MWPDIILIFAQFRAQINYTKRFNIIAPFQLLDSPKKNYRIVEILTEGDQLKILYQTKYSITPTFPYLFGII